MKKNSIHDKQLIEQYMPFLWKRILQLLPHGENNDQEDPNDQEEGDDLPGLPEDVDSDSEENQIKRIAGISYDPPRNSIARTTHRSQRVRPSLLPCWHTSTEKFFLLSLIPFFKITVTICYIIAFAQNQRNAFQLKNAVRFLALACGMSERVHGYLNYMSLASSRSTRLSALKALAKESASVLKSSMAIHNDMPLAPSIYIHNIDMEQKILQQSVGNRPVNLCGTWGISTSQTMSSSNHSPNQSWVWMPSRKHFRMPDLQIQPRIFMST